MSGRGTDRMYDDEQAVDAALVRRLLARRFPTWSNRRIVPVQGSGTVNVIYRLGDDLAVRLPRRTEGADGIAREQHWLPILAPLLPVAVPEVVGVGNPTTDFPHQWSVVRWLDGTNPDPDRLGDPESLALRIAEVVRAFRRIERTDAPTAHRGGPLAPQDAATRDAITRLPEDIDAAAVTAVWDETLRVPEWQREPVWLHADLMPGNLLVRNEQLSAVLDFGTVGVGDPACDLMVAWNLLPPGLRPTFREAVDVDDDTWLRGRGRALSMSVIALPYYQNSNRSFAANARHVIREVLAVA